MTTGMADGLHDATTQAQGKPLVPPLARKGEVRRKRGPQCLDT